ncbi:MAG: hypothetical protein QXR59_03715 [Candidatus Bathyarchaeia archaeon]
MLYANSSTTNFWIWPSNIPVWFYVAPKGQMDVASVAGAGIVALIVGVVGCLISQQNHR